MSLEDVVELGEGARADVIAAQSTLDVWQIFSSYQQPAVNLSVPSDESFAESTPLSFARPSDLPPIIPVDEGAGTRRHRNDLVRRPTSDAAPPSSPEELGYAVHIDLPQQPPKRPRLIAEEPLLVAAAGLPPPPALCPPRGRLVTEASLQRAQEAALVWAQLREAGSVFRGHLPALMSLGESRGRSERDELAAPGPIAVHSELLG